MNILDSASEILIYLFSKRINFVQSFHDYFEKHTDVAVDDKKKIINLYGCELRHHFFFTYLLDRYCPEIKGDAYYYTCIGLSNIFFVKEFTVEDSVTWINEILKK